MRALSIDLVTDGPAASPRIRGLLGALQSRGHHVRLHHGPGSRCPASAVAVRELKVEVAGAADHLAGRWRQDPPDIVHAHGWANGLAAQRAAQLLGGAGGPVIVQSSTALDMICRRRRVAAAAASRTPLLEAAVVRAAGAVHACTIDEVERLLALGARRSDIDLVVPGVDVELFTPDGPAWPRGEQRRLVAVRGWSDEGAAAAISVLPWLTGAELVVPGGPESVPADLGSRRLLDLARRCGVAQRVRLVGPLAHSRMPALLRSADVVVCAGSAAHSGTVAIEAMACGAPVVGTATGGLVDAVVERATGDLVPAEDRARLAAALRELLGDPVRLAGYGLAGVDRARTRYAWSRVGAEAERAYARALAARSGRAAAPAGGSRADDDVALGGQHDLPLQLSPLSETVQHRLQAQRQRVERGVPEEDERLHEVGPAGQ